MLAAAQTYQPTSRRPSPLPILVNSYTLYTFFQAWLRKKGIEPDSVLSGAPIEADLYRGLS